jgi:trans-aconitate methyltransferase
MATQIWDPSTYAHNARFVADLGSPLLELLHARAGERILDLGCGDGALTLKIAATGAQVVGVDSSPELIAAAVRAGVDARIEDGHELPFTQEFDAVISNAALHWMLRPDDVLSGVARALKPGGRFVAEFGGHGNVASIVVALFAVVRRYQEGRAVSSPWYFPTADAYEAKLRQHGFSVEHIALIPRPTPLPTGMEGWLKTFARPFLGALPAEVQDAALTEAIELLRPALCDEDGNWIADYVRLRFVAILPKK